MLRFCMWKRVFGILGILAGIQFAGVAYAAEPGSPEETIEQFNSAILDAMSLGSSADIYSRYKILHDAVGEAFDMKVLARATINRVHWRTWTPEQRAQYVVTLQRYQSAALADRFEGNSRISFAIDRCIDVPPKAKVVETRIIRPGEDKEDIDLDYRLVKRTDRWRIIDIYMNSRVSEVAMRRSEYYQVVRDEGYDALIAALEKQTKRILGKDYEQAHSASSATAS